MKVAIESSGLLVPNKTGVEHYTQRLLHALFEIDSQTVYYLSYLAFATRTIPDFDLDFPNVHQRRIRWLPGKIYNAFLRTPFGLPIDALAGLRPDVFFFPNFVSWPLWFTEKSLIIVHDLSFLEYPEVSKTSHHRWYLTKMVPLSIKRATKVIAISESTKRSITKHYGTPADKITVVPPSVDHTQYQPSSPEAIKQVRAKYGIARDYMLYLGTLEPRKNIVRIVAAYQALPVELRDRYQLVLAGGSGWGSEDIQAAINQVDAKNLVRTGYVADPDIAALYSGATVFIYPSIYEGWGMQVLEAMACGVPVLTANNSSLPEAGGDAAAYVDATDQNDINTRLQNLLEDPKERAAMVKRGLTYAKQFSWEKSGQILYELLQSL